MADLRETKGPDIQYCAMLTSDDRGSGPCTGSLTSSDIRALNALGKHHPHCEDRSPSVAHWSYTMTAEKICATFCIKIFSK
jgi:hypothetical protein